MLRKATALLLTLTAAALAAFAVADVTVHPPAIHPGGGGGVSLSAANTWTGEQTFSTGNTLYTNAIYVGPSRTSASGIVWMNTSQTPDTMFLGANTTGNSYIIAESADEAFDFAHAQQTNPTVFLHSAAQSTTQFAAYTHLGQAPNRVTVTVDGVTTFAITTGYVVLACTGAETINTITGGILGAVLVIENTDTECTIADDDAAGGVAANAINLTGAATDVGAVDKVITLIYNGAYWLQVSESANG